jgi:hypothetical protein
MTAHIEIPRSPSSDGILDKLGFDSITDYLLPIALGPICRTRSERFIALPHHGCVLFTAIRFGTFIRGITEGAQFLPGPVRCVAD